MFRLNGNFITSTVHAVDFHGTRANDDITINIVNIAAIDGGGVSGATGISLSGVTTFSCGGNTISVPSFFGGFDETVKYSYLNFPNFLNQFYLRAADISLEYLNLVNLTEGGALPFLGGNKAQFTSVFTAPLLNVRWPPCPTRQTCRNSTMGRRWGITACEPRARSRPCPRAVLRTSTSSTPSSTAIPIHSGHLRGRRRLSVHRLGPGRVRIHRY